MKWKLSILVINVYVIAEPLSLIVLNISHFLAQQLLNPGI